MADGWAIAGFFLFTTDGVYVDDFPLLTAFLRPMFLVPKCISYLWNLFEQYVSMLTKLLYVLLSCDDVLGWCQIEPLTGLNITPSLMAEEKQLKS